MITVAALALLFGAGSIADLAGGKKSGRYAGEVFGKTVTLQEFNQFYRATQLFMPSEKEIEDPELLREYTWQNIIYAREAKRNSINVSDAEVRNEVANILKQQGLTNPTNEQYKMWLTRTLHISPREFEEGLREFIRIQKLLRVKIAGFAPKDADKLTDAKAKEEAAEKQKAGFMTWSNDVNKRAALSDFLAAAAAQGEIPAEVVEAPAPGTQPVPAPEPVTATAPEKK
jgi:hypothetical protein